MHVFRRQCAVCAAPGPALCDRCRRRLVPPPATRVRGVGRVPAVFSYEGTGAAVVQALKYRDGRRLVTPLAAAMAGLVDPDVVTVTWLPTSTSRRRERGFDQAELLARAVARRLGAPAVRALDRLPGPAQTGRSRQERRGNVGLRVRRRVRGPVLVVDDVCTTGASLRAAMAALGPVVDGQVGCVVVARTP